MQVSPTKGNVGFAAAQSGWSFTLQSFARLYCDVYGIRLDTAEFARRLVSFILWSLVTQNESLFLSCPDLLDPVFG